MKKKYLSELQELLKAMLQACEQEDWALFSIQEKQRQILIKQIAQEKNSNKEDIDGLREILFANKALMNKANQIKEASGQSLIDLKRQQKKSKLYQH